MAAALRVRTFAAAAGAAAARFFSTFTSRTSCFARVLLALFAGLALAATLAPDLSDFSVFGRARPRGGGVVTVLLRAGFLGLDAVLLGAPRVVVRRALLDFGCASPSE